MRPKSISQCVRGIAALLLTAPCVVWGAAAAASEAVSEGPDFFGFEILEGLYLRTEVETEDPEPAEVYAPVPELPALVAKGGLGMRFGDLTLEFGPRYFDEKIAVEDLELDAVYRLGTVELGVAIENVIDTRETQSELFVRLVF